MPSGFFYCSIPFNLLFCSFWLHLLSFVSIFSALLNPDQAGQPTTSTSFSLSPDPVCSCFSASLTTGLVKPGSSGSETDEGERYWMWVTCIIGRLVFGVLKFVQE